jgi:predicted GNAT family acetyltransferase
MTSCGAHHAHNACAFTHEAGVVTMELSVVDVPERSRYEVSADGRVVGFSAYHLIAEGVLALPHVEVEPDFEGKGVASELMRRSLDQIRERELRIVPICPFAQAFLERNPHYGDLVHSG